MNNVKRISIENILSKLSIGSDGVMMIGGGGSNTLPKNAIAASALRDLTHEAVDILLLVRTGDYQAAGRLFLPLVNHVQEIAIENNWKAFKVKNGSNCWESLTSIAITEFMHGNKPVYDSNGVVELDEDKRPVTKRYRHSDNAIAKIMGINTKTANKYKAPMMHMHITTWMKEVSRDAELLVIENCQEKD